MHTKIMNFIYAVCIVYIVSTVRPLPVYMYYLICTVCTWDGQGSCMVSCIQSPVFTNRALLAYHPSRVMTNYSDHSNYTYCSNHVL